MGAVVNAETEPYEDTLFHIDLIIKKRQKLLNAQVEAERQVLHRIGRDYVAGRLTLTQLHELYRRYRDLVYPEDKHGRRAYVSRPAFSELWNEAVPVYSHKIAQAVKSEWLYKRYEPNGDGTWWGDNPLTTEAPRPRDGQCVVYVLFDDVNVPCYVGSTEAFKSRLKAHTREKAFSRWVAFPCADREAAYVLEVKLLGEHKPYLNKRVGR